MSDVFDKQTRSKVMSAVRSEKNKSTELKLLNLFKEYKIIGWRRRFKLFGKPDFVFPKKRIAVFVDGCFWHGHIDCKRNLTPKQNFEYWNKKIQRNIERDIQVTEDLTRKKWNVIRIWECELKNNEIVKEKLEKIIQFL